jgi:hypothetical protein
MTTTSIDKEIIAVEREYWDSMISKDPSVATRLTATESVIVGAQGVSTVTSKGIGEMVKSDGWKLKKYDFSDIKVMSPAPDVAIIGYHVREELEVEGKALDPGSQRLDDVGAQKRQVGQRRSHRVRGG